MSEISEYLSSKLTTAEANLLDLARMYGEACVELLGLRYWIGGVANDIEMAARMLVEAGDDRRVACDRAAAAEAQTATLAKRLAEVETENERLRSALKPFDRLAMTWTVEIAAIRGDRLTVSNGQRMCAIEASAFIAAKTALASTPTVPEPHGEQERQEVSDAG